MNSVKVLALCFSFPVLISGEAVAQNNDACAAARASVEQACGSANYNASQCAVATARMERDCVSEAGDFGKKVDETIAEADKLVNKPKPRPTTPRPPDQGGDPLPPVPPGNIFKWMQFFGRF